MALGDCQFLSVVKKKKKQINKDKKIMVNAASRSSQVSITQHQFLVMHETQSWFTNNHTQKISEPNSSIIDCGEFIHAGLMHRLTGSLANQQLLVVRKARHKITVLLFSIHLNSVFSFVTKNGHHTKTLQLFAVLT